MLYVCQDLGFDICRQHYFLKLYSRMSCINTVFGQGNLFSNSSDKSYIFFGPHDLRPEIKLHVFISFFLFLILLSWHREVVGSIPHNLIYFIFFCSWLFQVDREGVGSNLHSLTLFFFLNSLFPHRGRGFDSHNTQYFSSFYSLVWPSGCGFKSHYSNFLFS